MDTTTSTTSWLDRIEKTGRLLLWLALASAVVIIPITYVGHLRDTKRAETKAEEELHDAVKKAETKLDDLEKKTKSRRMPLAVAAAGAYLSAIAYSAAQGSLWFTNVSPRTGTLCLVAQAQATGSTSDSMPACADVGAFATVHMTFMFAGGDLRDACPKSDCHLTFREAPEGKEPKAPDPNAP